LPTIAQITDLTGYFDGTTNSFLRLSFYGRGLWQSPLYPTTTSGGCTTAFEPNETQATAKTITAGATNSAAITTATDVDYFKVVTTATSNNTFDLSGPAGLDYDLYIYNSAGTQIGASESATAVEKVDLTNQVAGTYFIGVFGYAGALSTTCYTIKATITNLGITTSDKKVINRASGKALEDGGFSTADGAPINQWTYVAGVNQLWQFVDLGTGYYKILNKHSGKALENPGFSTVDGTGMVQYGYVGGANQQWQVVDLGTGYYKLINRHSGKILDNPGSGTANGSQMIQYTDNGTAAQQWQISDGTLGVPAIVPGNQALSEEIAAGTDVQIFPNPAKSETSIIIINAEKDVTIAPMQVMDAQGGVLLFRYEKVKEGSNKVTLDVNGFTAGMYFVRVLMNEKTIVRKMIVEK
jgi:hypothetical protein